MYGPRSAYSRQTIEEHEAAIRAKKRRVAMTTPTTLARYAKAIAAVVEAGGPEPNQTMSIPNGFIVGTTARMNGVLKDANDEGMGVFNDEAVIAVLEKYVREDVVVWASKDVCQVAEPMYIGDDTWLWEVEYERYSTNDGTHTIQFLEMLASVVAGEKGEVG